MYKRLKKRRDNTGSMMTIGVVMYVVYDESVSGTLRSDANGN